LEERVNQGVNIAFRGVLGAEISEGKSSSVLSVDVAGLEVLQEELSVSRNIMNGQFTNTFSNDLSQVFVGSFRVVEKERDEVFLLEKLVNFNVTSSDNFLQSIQKQILEVLLFIQKINNNWQEIGDVSLRMEVRKLLIKNPLTKQIPPKATEA